MVLMMAIVAVDDLSRRRRSVGWLWRRSWWSDIRGAHDNGTRNHGLVAGVVRNYGLRITGGHKRHKTDGDQPIFQTHRALCVAVYVPNGSETRRSFSLSKKEALIAAIVVLVVLIALGAWLATSSRPLYPVMSGGKYGYIDKSAKVVIPPRFDEGENFSEGMAVVRMEGKYGYIDKSGKAVIAPQFATAGDFPVRLAMVRLGDKFGYIDKSGKVKINPQFDTGAIFPMAWPWSPLRGASAISTVRASTPSIRGSIKAAISKQGWLRSGSVTGKATSTKTANMFGTR
jgi:hypothetical protein